MSDFPSNRAGFREKVHRIHPAEKVPRPLDKPDFSPSRVTFFQSIAIICDAKMKRLSLGYFLQFTTSVGIKLTSVCVKLTLDVYRNQLTLVSKRLCIETSVKPLKSVPDCIAHTMRCTLGTIQHGRGVTQKNILVSYII